MAHKEVLKDLRSECSCEKLEYCPLEILLEPYSERTLEQHKLVEIFKFCESNREQRDIGWAESYNRWCQDGYAKAFDNVYRDGLKHNELYPLILKFKIDNRKA